MNGFPFSFPCRDEQVFYCFGNPGEMIFIDISRSSELLQISEDWIAHGEIIVGFQVFVKVRYLNLDTGANIFIIPTV